MPLFYKPHVDMTNAVIQTLKMQLPRAPATAAAIGPDRPRGNNRINTRARDGPSRHGPAQPLAGLSDSAG